MSPLKRTAILADALAAQFNRDPDRLADASGVYVRAAPLESVAVLYAPGLERDAPSVIAVSEAARDAVRDFLVAWALGLWALGYDDRVVYWRSYDDSAAIADPADAVATAFATTFLGARDGDAMRTGTRSG